MATLNRSNFITIGDLSRRTGVAVSALRFYEDKGLLEPLRTSAAISSPTFAASASC